MTASNHSVTGYSWQRLYIKQRDVCQQIGLLLLLTLFTSCSRSLPVRASLNQSAWFGSFLNGSPKLYYGNKVSLIFITDLPHPELKRKPINKPTGCQEPCRQTQTLLIGNIPLQTGRYKVFPSSLADSLGPTGVRSNYITLGVEKINSAVYKQAEGWLRVTRYDSVSGSVKGKFDIRFQADNGDSRSMHFKRGKLNFSVKKKQTT
ncbi:hypothetical protein [Spirosoma sordidisoli]|uniref:Uncharacterized protein n=1 Tax=Spirosoma sordidisoli TaxID=2502893 RepID=A0A4Q2UPF5_9BACT|nr:hypothetical protein [Spirosoma sordidisoli]RYC69495.1 hypothetical protein EQG79_12890 [Spirosoma sordidisoli]